jgi:hypothetical protein
LTIACLVKLCHKVLRNRARRHHRNLKSESQKVKTLGKSARGTSAPLHVINWISTPKCSYICIVFCPLTPWAFYLQSIFLSVVHFYF